MLSVWVARLCGAVLLTAVALKLQGQSSGTSGINYFSPSVQLVAMEVEALVGVWLLVGWARQAAWLAGLLLFTTLAGVSLYLGLVGQASCGCFGRVEVSPWGSLALDATCVLALAASRPAGVSLGELFTARRLLPIAGVTLAVGGLMAASTSTLAGRELARLRGEALLVAGGDADVGAAPKGDSRTLLVTVENLTGVDLRLVGGTSSCACVVTDDLPLTIPAGGKATAHVTIKFTGEVGRFKHTFLWYTDASTQPRLYGSVAGQVMATVE